MNNAKLYEHDFNAWIYQQISLLKAGKTDELDVEHLIEELEDMGKSNLRELESRLIILIAQQFQLAMLETQWQNFEGKSWRKTIIEQRSLVSNLLEEMPSLRQKLQNAAIKTYHKAVSICLSLANLNRTERMNTIALNLEVPSSLLLSLKIPKQQWDKYLRQTLAVELYREEKLSLGKAKELAGLSTKWEMIQLLNERKVDLNYSTDDWQSDLETLNELFS
ncbi:MAG: DUF29 family protein [Thioploca sp.]|nr:DUF29 family protein [Thioploca sp.]